MNILIMTDEEQGKAVCFTSGNKRYEGKVIAQSCSKTVLHVKTDVNTIVIDITKNGG